jgi:hypothetical protein
MDHLLRPIRERYSSLVALASVLDDVHIIDRDLDVALAVFAGVREELERVGLPLNLRKCKILSAQALDEPQTDAIGQVQLQVANDGVVLLGTSDCLRPQKHISGVNRENIYRLGPRRTF